VLIERERERYKSLKMMNHLAMIFNLFNNSSYSLLYNSIKLYLKKIKIELILSKWKNIKKEDIKSSRVWNKNGDYEFKLQSTAFRSL